MRVEQAVVLVGTSPDEAYARWLAVVWRGSGGLGRATIIVEGDADGTGSRRRVGTTPT
eukprot:m.135463 g.135463  ORF g.135463 m.135463 type:complete len:58 (+) comp22597_c0_seq2:295-468(+)